MPRKKPVAPQPPLTKHPGSLKQQAARAGLDVNAYVQKVLRPPQAGPHA
jgi:hypothetical protein